MKQFQVRRFSGGGRRTTASPPHDTTCGAVSRLTTRTLFSSSNWLPSQDNKAIGRPVTQRAFRSLHKPVTVQLLVSRSQSLVSLRGKNGTIFTTSSIYNSGEGGDGGVSGVHDEGTDDIKWTRRSSQFSKKLILGSSQSLYESQDKYIFSSLIPIFLTICVSWRYSTCSYRISRRWSPAWHS